MMIIYFHCNTLVMQNFHIILFSVNYFVSKSSQAELMSSIALWKTMPWCRLVAVPGMTTVFFRVVIQWTGMLMSANQLIEGFIVFRLCWYTVSAVFVNDSTTIGWRLVHYQVDPTIFIKYIFSKTGSWRLSRSVLKFPAIYSLHMSPHCGKQLTTRFCDSVSLIWPIPANAKCSCIYGRLDAIHRS